MTDPGEEDARAQAYFRAVEEIFIRLRGAPLLISPADWQLVREWHRAGVPLPLVQTVLEELFQQRRERGAVDRIQSLRYCRNAVESAWRRVQELGAGAGAAATEPALDVAARLELLAARLPADLAERERWRERLLAMDGAAEQVEAQLAELDRELLESVAAALQPARRRELDSQVAAALARLAGRLSETEVAEARERVWRQHLRRRVGLPLLSLFAPEADDPVTP